MLRRTIIFALFALASFMAPIANAQWTEAYFSTASFSGFYFTDSLNGWFSHGGSQKIIHTSDGGYTFDVQSVIPGQYTLYDVYMEDNLNGWACGSNTGFGPGYIYRTTNGGATWVQKTHPASQSNWGQIEKVGNSIWIIGLYSGSSEYLLIMKTSDDGNSWQLEEYPQIEGAAGIYVFDSMNFIAYGMNGLLVRTTDGGNSWISANLLSDYITYNVAFVDNNLGYAMVAYIWSGLADSYLYRTTDGGLTWNLHYSWVDQGAKIGLSVIPGTNTIFVTGDLVGTSALEGIIKSVDGGITWETLMQVTSLTVRNILTPDLRHGWAVGSRIYRYDYVTPPTIEPISNKLIQFGQAFTYQVQATGMGLKYTMSGEPNGLNIGLYSGLIQGTPSQGGNFPITVTVKDTDANVVNTAFNLRVNRQPLFMPPLPPTHAWVDSTYQVTLNVEDVDDDTVSFYWLSKPNWLGFLTEGITTVVISGVPSINDTGYVNISVLADDGYGGQDTLSWILQVELYLPPVNHAPQFVGSWPDTVTVYRDSSYTWNFEFQDMDGDSLFTIPGQIGVPGLSLLEGSGLGTLTAQVQGQPTDTGWFTAIVAVKDEHGAEGTLQFTVYVDFVTGVEPIPGVPTDYALEQNYPNPFNPSTTIEYSIPRASEVRLTVYSLLGEEVEVLVNQYQPVGFYQVDFNGSSLPSGIYFYRLEAGSYTSTKKMVLTK